MSSPPPLYCDICGAANRPQARFCFACGQPLQNGTYNTPVNAGTTVGGTTTTGLLGPSHILKRRYRITGQIGKGGFGAVYKALDTEFNSRFVAIKEMSQSSLSPQEIIEATDAFKRESRLLSGLTHPNLPRIYDNFNDIGRWYLVMDFIEGETLEDHLEKIQGGRLPLEEVLDIGIQLCTVLGYLHNRYPPIIFRDLKPANVILTPDDHLYLIDFGIARLFKPGQAKDTTAFGSAGYAAPEQYGKAQTTPQADIYSLGATLHQLLTGDDPSLSPFRFAALHEQDPIHKQLDRLLAQMVEMDASKRPTSIAEVKRELQRITTMRLTTPLAAAASQATIGTFPGGGQPQSVQPQPTQLPPMPPLAPPQPLQSPQPATGTGLHGVAQCIYRGHTKAVYGLCWSPDSKRIASGSADGTLQVWDAASGNTLLTCRGHKSHVYAVAWSPDGRRIASGSRDGTVRVWDAVSGKELVVYHGHASFVQAVAWAPDNQRIASGGNDKNVQVWEVANTSLSSTYKGHTDGVKAVAWSPDGWRIASGGKDKILQVWQAPKPRGRNFFTSLFSYRGQFSCRGYAARIDAVAWAPDGRRIASGQANGAVQLWDANNGNLTRSYRGHTTPIYALAWSPSSKFIASGGREGTVHIWNTITGNRLFTYTNHSNFVLSIGWSPDGTRIASAGNDKTVQVWQVV